ncbi:hypothetical protein AB9P05_23900 [Roseivirga sp. BDSF3-8]|uniref:hypothetical protein n=1 Tax=Roseivirga sp. BDSF3-8 TaxID=3241598 RepID=UPI003531B6C8
MIIYGSKATHLKSAQSNTATCVSCGTKGSVSYSVFSKHAHIFWIPVFPIGRVGASQCGHCKHTVTNKEMTGDSVNDYKNLKNETKVPFWKFSGLFLIVMLVAFGVYASGENDKKNAEYISNPAAGDVYEYKLDGDYSTMKVSRVAGDSVYVFINEYVTNKKTGINEIDKPQNYVDFEVAYSKAEIQQKFIEKNIYDVNR